MEQVVLVDENDNQIGVEEKLKAHVDGKLHRAFSIFIFNNKKELMLQKRAKHKYHSGSLWTNTVCSHPRPDENTEVAAHRRLKEEMGFDCNLNELLTFTYKVELDNNLTEYEFDHVFVGIYDSPPIINVEEAEEWKWIDTTELLSDIETDPNNYTFWLKTIIKKVLEEQK